MSTEERILRIGLLGAGGKLVLDSTFLSFTHPYGKSFRVPRAQIQTVTVDALGWGKALLKIIGGGTTLASAEMPASWATKCQEWILKNLS